MVILHILDTSRTFSQPLTLPIRSLIPSYTGTLEHVLVIMDISTSIYFNTASSTDDYGEGNLTDTLALVPL